MSKNNIKDLPLATNMKAPTSSLCVMMFRLINGSGMTTVSPIRTPQLCAMLYTITTMHVSSLSTMPNVLPHTKKDIRSPNLYETVGQETEVIPCTHNETLPSEARLNTTLPRAATPPLWPCLREDNVRGSRLPIWPEGERNSGEEHGPSSDTLRLESIFCNRRGFVFPC